MLALLLAAISIQTNFEGGNLGKVERVTDTHFRCRVAGEADQDKRNRQANWYYFRIDNAAGREITIDLVDLVGEYDYRPGAHAVTRDTYPVYSYDRKTWRHFEAIEWDDKEPRLRLGFTPALDTMWIAHVPPYTTQDLERLLFDLQGHPHLKRAVIGTTPRRRDLVLLTITNPVLPDKAKKVVWLMFRQHAWESGSSWVGEGALRFLLSPDAASLRDHFIFKILPMADPDGVARGGVRFNAKGYDLNRNWDTADASRTPEIFAERKTLYGWLDSGGRIDLFLSLHNTETAEYIDGPESPVITRLYDQLTRNTTFHPTRPPRGFGPRPASGRMNVADALWFERGVTAGIMEQMIAYNSKLGRRPAVEDRLAFGRELIRAIAAALRAAE